MRESISLREAGGNTSISHNNRTNIHGNEDIDQNRSSYNIYYKQEKIEEVYEKLFSDSLTKYNDKQKRVDRKIDNYLEKVRNDKRTKDVQREIVAAIGKKEDFEGLPEGKATELWERRVRTLDQYAREFEKNNPNLYVYNMTLHQDEANPHLHINFVPFHNAHEKQNREGKRVQGMSEQYSMDGALQEQRIKQGLDLPKSVTVSKKEEKTGKNVDIQTKVQREIFHEWQEEERNKLEKISQEYEPAFKRDVVGTHRYMSPENFKSVKREEEKIQQEMENAQERLEELEKGIMSREIKKYELSKDIKALNAENLRYERFLTNVDDLPVKVSKRFLKGSNGLRKQDEDHYIIGIEELSNINNIKRYVSSTKEELDFVKEDNHRLKKENKELKSDLESSNTLLEGAREEINLLKRAQERLKATFLFARSAISKSSEKARELWDKHVTFAFEMDNTDPAIRKINQDGLEEMTSDPKGLQLHAEKVQEQEELKRRAYYRQRNNDFER